MGLRCFDQDNCYFGPVNGPWKFDGSMTAAIWIYLFGTGSDDSYFCQWGTGGNTWVLGRQQAGGFAFAGINTTTFVGGSAPPTNRWQHLSMSWISGTSVNFFQDGVSQGSAGAGAHSAGGAFLTIGNQAGGSAGCNAMFAHAAIWNVALTNGEQSALARCHPFAIRRGNLVAYFPLAASLNPGQQLIGGNGGLYIDGSKNVPIPAEDIAQPPIHDQWVPLPTRVLPPLNLLAMQGAFAKLPIVSN